MNAVECAEPYNLPGCHPKEGAMPLHIFMQSPEFRVPIMFSRLALAKDIGPLCHFATTFTSVAHTAEMVA